MSCLGVLIFHQGGFYPAYKTLVLIFKDKDRCQFACVEEAAWMTITPDQLCDLGRLPARQAVSVGWPVFARLSLTFLLQQ